MLAPIVQTFIVVERGLPSRRAKTKIVGAVTVPERLDFQPLESIGVWLESIYFGGRHEGHDQASVPAGVRADINDERVGQSLAQPANEMSLAAYLLILI